MPESIAPHQDLRQKNQEPTRTTRKSGRGCPDGILSTPRTCPNISPLRNTTDSPHAVCQPRIHCGITLVATADTMLDVFTAVVVRVTRVAPVAQLPWPLRGPTLCGLTVGYRVAAASHPSLTHWPTWGMSEEHPLSVTVVAQSVGYQRSVT